MILVLGGLFAMIAAASGPNDFWISLTLLSGVVGSVSTPISVWMAYRQLRTDPAAPGRDLVLKSALVFGTIAPILLVLFAAAITNGAAFILFGIAALFYVQYLLLRRFWRCLSDALPTPPSASTTNSASRQAPSAVQEPTPMPAM
jgi:protein-S-isoprenylcysteine O-methyltransferase Ste14